MLQIGGHLLPDKAFRTTIGGQAVLEGIMMRGPEAAVAVVRTADGSLTVKPFPSAAKRPARHPLKWPFIRGIHAFLTSLALGYAALEFSSSLLPDESEQQSRFERWLSVRSGSEVLQKAIMTLGIILGTALSVGLFVLLPTLMAGWAAPVLPHFWMRNLTEGAFRLIIFLGYLTLVSRMKEIQRVFAYHGAEHKVIACYEADAPLTVADARACSRRHPRCGTSFLLVVVIVSVLIFSFVRWSNAWVRMALRLVLLPVVVAVSYEINRLVGRYDNPVTRFFRAPGLWLQGLTTREPDDSMLEVGLAALKAVLPKERGADLW